MVRARDLMKSYPADLNTAVLQAGGAGGGQADVQYVLTGPDLDKLNAYSQAMVAKDEADSRTSPTRIARWCSANRNCASKSTGNAPRIWACE